MKPVNQSPQLIKTPTGPAIRPPGVIDGGAVPNTRTQADTRPNQERYPDMRHGGTTDPTKSRP